MEQQTPIPPPGPQIKDEAARRAKTRHFPILDFGEEGVSKFSIYFVQDCSIFWAREDSRLTDPIILSKGS